MFNLLGDQIFPGDVHFFVFRITGNFDGFTAVPQRLCHGIQVVGCRNKQYLGKINRKFNVMIPEMAVLVRIKNLQQRRRRIAAVVRRHLVNLIQKDQRIFHSRLPQCSGDSSRHSSDVRTPVAADFRFITNAAQCNPHVRPPERTGDRPCNGGLPGSRRPRQTKDRTIPFLRQRSDRQILNDAGLYLFKAVVILIKDLPGMLQIRIFLTHLIPGHFQQRLNVGS